MKSKRQLEIEESDRKWHEFRKEHGLEMPEKPFFLLRLPVIRHIRYIVHVIRLEGWVRAWGGLCMSPTDEWVMWAIYRGWY